MKIDTKHLKEELALEGAKARVGRIQHELDALHREFPGLFPSAPVVTHVERVAMPKAAQARHLKELVRGAEKMRAAKPKRQKRAWSKRMAIQVPVDQSSDPTGLTVTVGEAAQLLGLSNSAIRIRIKAGKLKIYDSNGPEGVQRLLRADVLPDEILSDEAMKVEASA